MSSLRARLVLALVLLAGAGLVAVGAIVYTEQQSFLYSRVNQQVQSSIGLVSRDLDTHGFAVAPSGAPFSPAAPGGGQPMPDGLPPGRGPGGHGPGGGEAGPHGSGVATLPPGTFGQRRTASGRVLGSVTLSYGETALPAPDLPARIPLGRLISVPARSGSGSYRVFAQRDPGDSGITVVAVPLGELGATLHRLLAVEVIVIAGVLLALGGLGWVVVRIGLAPLERIATAAGEIAGGDLDRRIDTTQPRSEVGRLGIALNTMLDRLQQAFQAQEASEERLRRFLADASHELRTPLASIRGYAELFRMGAMADPADAARALAGIESEAARMGVLVEDLLALARLDAVREPVRTRVDVSALAAAAVEGARVQARARQITLEAVPDQACLGDAHELRRVMDNLLRNAITHTPPGTPIEVAVRPVADTVELTVRDHGPGLPTQEPEALFERFWRAEPGRGRGRAGAGLGLAIVHAIVVAHGGAVRAANAPGGGACFSVSLRAGGTTEPVTTPGLRA
ncbi:MAG TPA: HAMP domain-containing sensor histidine kinase [Solirubrobacteraceae bacterium]|nr:HAMP domain-containing sensor histidine kinase [Solirubrobacteraceae bacterium]